VDHGAQSRGDRFDPDVLIVRHRERY